jgi:acetyl-CoA synthetase
MGADDARQPAFVPDQEFVESTNVWEFMQTFDMADYEELIRRTTGSVEGEPASGIDWFWDTMPEYLGLEFDEPYDTVRDDSDGPQFTEWYPGGQLNIAHNVLERHAATDSPARNDSAIIWEGEPGDTRTVTFHDLDRQASQVANALQARGVGTGDTVGLYMPMVPEVAAILYGCFKVGALAVPIFSGFGVDATATRISDAECSVLFTADGFYRRGSELTLKDDADAAVDAAGHVEHTIVYDRLGTDVPLDHERDEWWETAVGDQPATFDSRSVPSNQASMLLYSSGTTGKPKGIVHTHAGVLMQCAKEIYFGFDHKPADRFFWVSDIGWMMGPWTLIGNHAFGGTVFMYEGAPDHPEPDRFWELIDRQGLTVFGISPTAIRALREHGDEWLDGHDLSSLRLLGSTGEPWDDASWQWFFERVGGGEAPIINISGGTEICGCFLMPMPIHSLSPCTLGGPGLGMAVDIVDADGNSVVTDHERGYLVARDSCPSMTKSLWSGDERYLDEYWSTWDDVWDHGDWARTDEAGRWYLQGRADDVLNVAGRKVGPAEVEGAAIEHPGISQAAAVGVPDETTGTAVVLFVITEPEQTEADDLRAAIRERVGAELGKPFRPRSVLFVDQFPKTQSGKIIRRVIAATHQGEDLGDMSSIENPEAVAEIESAR